MSAKFIISICLLLVSLTGIAGEIRYTLDQNRDYAVVVAESDENGNLLNTYTYGPDILPISRTDAVRGLTFYYQNDLKNITRVTDTAGNVVASYQYDAFGKVLGFLGPEARLEDLIFGGNRYEPSTGHYNARARQYNPNIGRFTQPDPWQGVPQAPRTLNKYNYAYADPVNVSDPSGNIGISSIGASLRVNGILTTSANAAGRSLINRTLVGAGKDAFGLVGEEIIAIAKESLLNILVAELSGGVTFANAGVRGTAAHQQFEMLIDKINNKYKKYGYVIRAEVFRDKNSSPGDQAARRAKGSLGIDVEVRNLKGKPVLAFDLKTGKRGSSKKRSRRLQETFGTDIIEIFVSKK